MTNWMYSSSSLGATLRVSNGRNGVVDLEVNRRLGAVEASKAAEFARAILAAVGEPEAKPEVPDGPQWYVAMDSSDGDVLGGWAFESVRQARARGEGLSSAAVYRLVPVGDEQDPPRYVIDRGYVCDTTKRGPAGTAGLAVVALDDVPADRHQAVLDALNGGAA